MAGKRKIKGKTVRSSIAVQKIPASFPQFSKLPPEIRYIIWEMAAAAEDHPFLHLAVRDTQIPQRYPQFSAKTTFDGISLVCQESRQLIHRNYDEDLVNAGIPLNFGRDCILLDDYVGPTRFVTHGSISSYKHSRTTQRCNLRIVDNFCDYMAINELSLDSIRHLAVMNENFGICSRDITNFRNLETVTLVFDFEERVMESKSNMLCHASDEELRLGKIRALSQVDKGFKGWKSGAKRRQFVRYMERYFEGLGSEFEGWHVPQVRAVEYVREFVRKK